MSARTPSTENAATMPYQQDATDRLKRTYEVLVGDCQEVEQLLRGSDTPCLRRVFVRVLSTFVEGMAHQMRCVVRDALKSFTPEELREIRDKCGFAECEIMWLNKKRDGLSAIERFSMAVACYARLHMEQFDLTCVEKLNTLAKIRNRITHPSSAADLEVSDKDRIDAWSAAEALIEDVTRLFSICNAKVRELSVD